MTLLNTTDAPCKVNTRTAKSPEELHRQLDARAEQLVITMENAADIAGAAMDEASAREMMDLAWSAKAELDEIRSLRAR